MSRVASITLSDLFEQLGSTNSRLEAAPYYTGIRIKMSVSGVRSKTVSSIETTQTFDYEIEETFSRVPLEFSSFTSGANGGLLGVDDYSSTDIGALEMPEGSDCYAVLTGEAFLYLPSPGYQTIFFILPEPPTPVETTIGIHEHNGVTSDLKTSTDWTPLAPQFFHDPTPPLDERVLSNRWGVTTFRTFVGDTENVGDDPVEASVASPASFRDLRGVQTVTVADPESGDWDSSTVSYTYEWEIL